MFGYAKSLVLVGLLATVMASKMRAMIDTSEEVQDPKCLSDKVEVVVFRAYQSTGRVDPNLAKNLEKFANSSTEVWVYMTPCYSCGEPKKQAEEVLRAIRSHDTPFVYINVESNGWDKNQTKNREFLTIVVNVFLPLSSKRVGILTTQHAWNSVFGEDCSDYAGIHLWYSHLDGKPDCHDFRPFGGWKTPAAKQYAGPKQLCGNNLNLDSNYSCTLI